MGDTVEVHAYSTSRLEELLAAKSYALPEVVHEKLHSLYFENYFRELNARTILVENDYIDRDYLEDFSGYYVRCFPDYPRKCTRLHFLKRNLTAEEFDLILRSQISADQIRAFQDDYLGFLVVKPLPQTIIGRTCLATYPSDGSRFYPITRRYEANVFGMPLQVETLAFQEQDSVAAACATSALWSVFHGTGVLFHHSIPSPVEITRAANALVPMESRSLPSRGLTAMQMAHAIRSVGLEPFLIGVRDEYLLKSAIYAYLRGRVPVVLGCDLFDVTTPASPAHRGKHAVAVTGFRLGKQAPVPISSVQVADPSYAGFLLRASQMDKIYAHDDQVGPFARMELDGQCVDAPSGSGTTRLSSVSTSWDVRQNKVVRACPELLLVPLYHKVRIPFEVILNLVMSFDGLIEAMRSGGVAVPITSRLTWDIYLTTVNVLKSELAQSPIVPESIRKDFRVRPMPRFLWRATATNGSGVVLELLFDATDLEQGRCFLAAIEYDAPFSRFLRALASTPQLDALLRTKPMYRILSWFKTQGVPTP